MNIAKEFGPGVFIMTFKTDFEITFDLMNKRLSAVAGQREKLNVANDAYLAKLADDRLFKSADPVALHKHLVELNRIAGDRLAAAEAMQKILDECNELADQCRAELPSFKSWVQNQATYDYGATLIAVDKAADSFNGDIDAMVESGALRRFYQPRQPIVDPRDAAADAVLQHRHDNRFKE